MPVLSSTPFWFLNTLILELAESIFNNLTVSKVPPIPTFKISFSLKLRLLRFAFGEGNLPWTLKNVTNPVTETFGTSSDNISFDDDIPIL